MSFCPECLGSVNHLEKSILFKNRISALEEKDRISGSQNYSLLIRESVAVNIQSENVIFWT